MNKIEVAIIDQHNEPEAIMMFLAALTQRGHKIANMADLTNLLNDYRAMHLKPETLKNVAALPHGTIKRFTPITVAIVGASRRFLAQARTHQVGMNFVSASLQYSDYSSSAQFVVPYALTEADRTVNGHMRDIIGEENIAPGDENFDPLTKAYLKSCEDSLNTYNFLIEKTIDNDTAGYAMPQGLRNVLIMQANHQAWDYFIRLRACRRNTDETRFVTTLIWRALLNSNHGEELFATTGPDCLFGVCREGKFSCKHPMCAGNWRDPEGIIRRDWPLISEEVLK